MNKLVAKPLGSHRRGRGRGRGRRRIVLNRSVAVLMLFAFMLLPIGFFGGGPALLKSYDAAHVVALRCTIRSSR